MGGRHSNGYATRDAALAGVDRMRAATDHKLADFGGSRDEAIADVLVYAKEYFASRGLSEADLDGAALALGLTRLHMTTTEWLLMNGGGLGSLGSAISGGGTQVAAPASCSF